MDTRRLLLGGFAVLIVTVGAQAAELPVKAKPVEYVRICSLYGAGFYYLPGTQTCLKVGGFVRAKSNTMPSARSNRRSTAPMRNSSAAATGSTLAYAPAFRSTHASRPHTARSARISWAVGNTPATTPRR
jgi:Porin subfamily